MFSVSGAQIKSLVIACNLKKGGQNGTLKCHGSKNFREKDLHQKQPMSRSKIIHLRDVRSLWNETEQEINNLRECKRKSNESINPT